MELELTGDNSYQLLILSIAMITLILSVLSADFVLLLNIAVLVLNAADFVNVSISQINYPA